MRRKVLAFGLLAVYLVTSVHLLRLDRETADALVREDSGFELLGALALFAGAALVVLALRRLRAHGDPHVLKQLSYAGVALILFVAAGEEISWGQRLLGIDTPEAIRKVNAQGETNLHNLYGDKNGQNASVLVFQAFWMSFGVLLPLAALWRPLRGLLRRYLPVIPAWLALLFIAQQLMWSPIRAEFRADPGAWNATYRGEIGAEPFRVENAADAQRHGVPSPAGLGEIMEANVQILLGVAALCLFLDARRRSPASSGARRHPAVAPTASRRFDRAEPAARAHTRTGGSNHSA